MYAFKTLCDVFDLPNKPNLCAKSHHLPRLSYGVTERLASMQRSSCGWDFLETLVKLPCKQKSRVL